MNRPVHDTVEPSKRNSPRGPVYLSFGTAPALLAAQCLGKKTSDFYLFRITVQRHQTGKCSRDGKMPRAHPVRTDTRWLQWVLLTLISTAKWVVSRSLYYTGDLFFGLVILTISMLPRGITANSDKTLDKYLELGESHDDSGCSALHHSKPLQVRGLLSFRSLRTSS